jgi:hypothetical protein
MARVSLNLGLRDGVLGNSPYEVGNQVFGTPLPNPLINQQRVGGASQKTKVLSKTSAQILTWGEQADPRRLTGPLIDSKGACSRIFRALVPMLSGRHRESTQRPRNALNPKGGPSLII